jgi:Tfp pilus assembly protein PilO
MFKSLTPTLSIITAIVLFMFFTQPMYDEVQIIREEIADYKDTTEDYQKFNAQLQRLKSEKDQINLASVERLEKMIPPTIDAPRLLVDLESMARSNGLLFGNITVGTGVAGKGASRTDTASAFGALASHSVTFEVIGTYEQFKEFIRGIENSLTFMEITNLTLTASTERFQQYGVTVQTYALPEVKN